MDKKIIEKLQNMSNALRSLSVDMVQTAKSGHPGMPLGMSDIATVLFTKHLKFSANNPNWFNRDRFILSAGHGSPLLYSLLYLTGYEDCNIEEIKNFRQLGSLAAGHPEYELLEGVETTTGPLGQGLATSVGIALAEKNLSSKFGQYIVDNYTYVIAGDGCLMEGISEEAISFAGHHKLNKLIVLWDDNQITIDGGVNISSSTNIPLRFKANGWNILQADGHDFESIDKAIEQAKLSDKPTIIACKTIIGKGVKSTQGTSKAHANPIGEENITALKKEFGFKDEPFNIPEDIISTWKEVGQKSDYLIDEWFERFEKLSDDKKEELSLFFNPNKTDITNTINEFKKNISKNPSEFDNLATRKASKFVLDKITPEFKNLIGGSADLTPANLTKSDSAKSINPLYLEEGKEFDNYNGDYVNYGIREHAMGAIMNGLALYGYKPFGGTFAAFSDYLKPSLRLSAIMDLPVCYVLTHDSIGVGEDGTTHQPIEQLASLRATPRLKVYRPADAIETVEAWEEIINSDENPSALVLSRQNLPLIRKDYNTKNMVSKGGYVISGNKGADIRLIATGSEVSLAIEVQKLLESKGNKVAVISMPCVETFKEQDFEYKSALLPEESLKIAIEAGSSDAWYRFADVVFGIDEFGVSAPGKKVFEYFEFTPEKISKEILEIIE